MLPLLPLAIGLVPQLARWLVGDKAGEVAASVAGVVQAVTGTDDPAAAAAAIADPERRATLQLELARIAADREAQERRDTLADVANARTQHVELARTDAWQAAVPAVLSGMVVVGFFGCVFLVFFSKVELDPQRAQLLNILLGALIPAFAQVLNFWLGSSIGSKRSGDAVREIAATSARGGAAPAAIATTAGVTVNAPAPRQPSPPGTTADTLNAQQLEEMRR